MGWRGGIRRRDGFDTHAVEQGRRLTRDRVDELETWPVKWGRKVAKRDRVDDLKTSPVDWGSGWQEETRWTILKTWPV